MDVPGITPTARPIPTRSPAYPSVLFSLAGKAPYANGRRVEAIGTLVPRIHAEVLDSPGTAPWKHGAASDDQRWG